MTWRQGQALHHDLRERVLATPGAAALVRSGLRLAPPTSSRPGSDGIARRRIPGPWRPHTRAKLDGYDEALWAELVCHPDAMLAELQAWVRSTRKVPFSSSAIPVRLKRLGLTLKKAGGRGANTCDRVFALPGVRQKNRSARRWECWNCSLNKAARLFRRLQSQGEMAGLAAHEHGRCQPH